MAAPPHVALVTGSGGLVGSESAAFLAAKGLQVLGLDNDLRRTFFGPEASTRWNIERLKRDLPGYVHHDADIRDRAAVAAIFAERGSSVALIIHAAGQPSHDWAARDPQADFAVNAQGTLNLLEAARRHCPKATFIFVSTNKVYGDAPNRLPLRELDTRWEIVEEHPYHRGIDEALSIDQSRHSLFGASKAAADLLVQEYARSFGMNTVCFRGGCITGPNHSGTQSHGFLAYLMRCAVIGRKYTVFGYKGKQVRDNLHARDLVRMFWEFHQAPRPGEVYNAGGGRSSNCSVLEAIRLCEELVGRKMDVEFRDEPRGADHVWYITDQTKFRTHYPGWKQEFGLRETLVEMHREMSRRETLAPR